MKKRWKIFWIVSLIMFCLGIGLCVAGFALGATWDMVENSTPGWINLGNGMEYNVKVGGIKEKEVLLDTTVQSFTGVKDIEIDAEAIELQILVSDKHDEVRVEFEDENFSTKMDCYKDGDELVIETNNRFKVNDKTETVWIHVPESYLDEVDINVEAGTVYIEEIHANSLSVNVEAGEAIVSKFSARTAEFECGAGRMEIYGDPVKELEAQCGAGEILLGIAGSKEDYNYEVECGIGEVIVGDESYSGIGRTDKHSNGASREMNIECGIGSITVKFDN